MATLTIEEQLADMRTPTQLGLALAEIRLGSIAACRPQAKDQIERVRVTLQSRTASYLRLCCASRAQ